MRSGEEGRKGEKTEVKGDARRVEWKGDKERRGGQRRGRKRRGGEGEEEEGANEKGEERRGEYDTW